MSILYDWYENPGASPDDKEAVLHPRIFLNGKVETVTLCHRIHESSSLTTGDVKSALDTLAQLFAEELREGRAVHIDGIGYFYPTLAATEKVTRSTPHKSTKLTLKTVRFRPDAILKGNFTGIHTNQTKYSNHSEKISEVEIDIRLKEYFAEHRMINRRDFQGLCGLARTTAKTHLVRLRQEGKLVNVGLPNQPMYMPAPGYYGVSRNEVSPTR